MQHVKFETTVAVAVVTMNRPKANPLNLELLTELLEAFELAAADEDVRAVLFTSAVPRFFSAGFDAKEVFSYNREQMTNFLGLFGNLISRILHFPKPVIGALSGHAVAGGAILALACDFRIMAEGDYRFAMNEIDVGVVLPHSLFKMLTTAVGVPVARRMILAGEALSPPKALEAGLVARVVPEANVAAAGLELAHFMSGKPPATFAALKRIILESTGVAGAAFAPEVEPWFTPEALAQKEKIRAGLADSSRGR